MNKLMTNLGAMGLTFLFIPLGFWVKGKTNAGWAWLATCLILGIATGGWAMLALWPMAMIHAFII